MRDRATEIVASPDTLCVEAVRCEDDDGRALTINADFVVEAAGRGSLTMQLLERFELQKIRRDRDLESRIPVEARGMLSSLRYRGTTGNAVLTTK
jgi:hypothetical protein